MYEIIRLDSLRREVPSISVYSREGAESQGNECGLQCRECMETDTSGVYTIGTVERHIMYKSRVCGKGPGSVECNKYVDVRMRCEMRWVTGVMDIV